MVGGKRRGAGGAGALALVAELGDGIASVVELKGGRNRVSRLFTQAEVGPVCGTVRTPSSVAPDYREGWWKGDWRATGGAVPARVVVGTAGGAAELNVAGRSIQTTWLILVALEWSSGKERKGNDKQIGRAHV